MFENLELNRMANAMASRAGARMGVIAQNIANADTPGYQTMDLPTFSDSYHAQKAMRATRAGHNHALQNDLKPEAFNSVRSNAPNGNTVSLEQEMVKSAGVRQDHEMALAIYRNTSDILRASLGKAR